MRRAATLLLLAACVCGQYQSGYNNFGQQGRVPTMNGINGVQQVPYNNPQYNQQQQGMNQQYPQNQQNRPGQPPLTQQQLLQQQQQQQYNGMYMQNGQAQNRYLNPNAVQPTPKPIQQNVNVPSKLATTTSQTGAQVDIKINSYSNQKMELPGGNTCNCQNNNCKFLRSDSQNACSFSFTTIISSSDQSVQYYGTDQYAFNGVMGPQYPGNWSNTMSFEFPSKPVAIDIFVYQLGIVMTQPDANGEQQLLQFSGLVVVDSFVVDVYNYDASQGQQHNSEILNGKMINSQMSVTWSVKCINGMMGADCDLTCGDDIANEAKNSGGPSVTSFASGGITTSSTTTRSPYNNNYNNNNNNYRNNFATGTSIICKDNQGVYSQCTSTNGNTGSQATNCVRCVNGVTNNGTCIGVLTEPVTMGVSSSFRTWTIILGCATGLLFIVIICLIISYCILRNQSAKEKDGYQAARGGDVSYPPTVASRPLLDDEWSAPPRRTVPPPHETSRASDDGYRNGNTVNAQQRQEHQV